jgi:hypothetical protein
VPAAPPAPPRDVVPLVSSAEQEAAKADKKPNINGSPRIKPTLYLQRSR